MATTTTPNNTGDREHDFVLVLSGITGLDDARFDALFEAGCDDATPSVRYGTVYLTFSRTAPALRDAVISAIRDVRRAAIGADVLRVDYNSLATQADIARKIGRSRELVHQFITGQRGPGGFPPPTCHIADAAPLWSWAEVAHWLWQNNMVKEAAVREAQEVELINNLLESAQYHHTEPALFEEISRSLRDAAQP